MKPTTRCGFMALLASLGLLIAAEAVCGQAPDHISAPFWRELSDAGKTRADQLVSQALIHVGLATRTQKDDWLTICRRTVAMPMATDNPRARSGRMRALRDYLRKALERRGHLDNAIARLQSARALRPSDPDVLFTLTHVLSMWEQPGPLWGCDAKRRDTEAIEMLEHLRRVDPQYLSSEVAFELGVIHTRARNFRLAAIAYARAAALSLDHDNVAVTRTNLAEVTMLSGDLDGALLQYERAIELADGGKEFLLSVWGLAVALDRLGEHEAAVEHARRAVSAEGGRMRVLRSYGVFFEPPHEIHYYEALGHEAMALIDEDRQDAERAAAVESWRAYLAGTTVGEGDGHDRDFRTAAAANLERLRAEPRTP